jgi:hypothetical protein
MHDAPKLSAAGTINLLKQLKNKNQTRLERGLLCIKRARTINKRAASVFT